MTTQATTVDAAALTKKYKKKSQFSEVWRRLRKNKAAMLGQANMILLVGLALAAPLIYDYDGDVISQNIKNRLQPPSAAHPFGTDEMGREILARVIWGAHIAFDRLYGCAFCLDRWRHSGRNIGLYGGIVDNVIMRIMDIFLAVPGTLLAITIAAALGPSTINLIIALSISSVPGFARIVRGSVLTVRDVEYIEAAKAIGASNGRILLQHVIPNSLAPVIVHTTLNVATIILTIAGLSFLGLGISAPTPEWGAMLSSGRTYLRNASYYTMFPGLAIMTTILALNLLGDGLRDALDPRLK